MCDVQRQATDKKEDRKANYSVLPEHLEIDAMRNTIAISRALAVLGHLYVAAICAKSTAYKGLLWMLVNRSEFIFVR